MSTGNWIFCSATLTIFAFMVGYELGKFREYRKVAKDISALKYDLQENKRDISGKYILNHHEKQVDHYWDGCWQMLLFCIEQVEAYLGKY